MTQTTIEQRLAKLERSNRRLKIAAGVLGAALVAGGFLAAERAAQPMTVLDSVTIVDSQNRLRARLGCDKEGTFLFLNDENGKMRTSVAAQKGGPYFNFKDDQGRTRILVTMDEAGPSVRIKDEAGATVAAVAADNQGPFVQLRDDAGRTRIVTTLSDVLSEPKPAEPPKDIPKR